MNLVKNLQRGPVSLMIKSKGKLRSFTTLTLPGIGSKKNEVRIPDELMTDKIKLMENKRLISISKVTEQGEI